jgi:hypothetical protein
MVDDTDIIPGMAISIPAPCDGKVPSEDFSNTPTTIGELSANRSKEAKDWSPRDVLIHILRRVDRGEIKPHNLMVIWDDTDHTSYTQSTENKYRSNWLLDRVKRMIMKDEEE